MMNDYRRAMERIRLSPQVRERIESAMEHPHHRRGLGRPAVLAAVLAVVLSVTAAATTAHLVLFHTIPRDVAETLQPVQCTVLSEGISLTVQSASTAGGRFRAYITLKDREGDRLSQEGFDLNLAILSNMVPYPTGRGEWVNVIRADYPGGYRTILETGPISYDEKSGTYGFLLEAYDQDGRDITFASETFLLEIAGFYTGKQTGEAVLSPAWPDASQQAETRRYSKGESLGAYSPEERAILPVEDGQELLLPQAEGLAVAENYDIAAMGWIDGKLHILERFSGGTGPEDSDWLFSTNSGQIFPTRPDGTQLTPELVYTYWSEEEQPFCIYHESVYNVSPAELAECTLTGSYAGGGTLIEGYWRAEFSLDSGNGQAK